MFYRNLIIDLRMRKSQRIKKYENAYKKCEKLIEEASYCTFEDFLAKESSKSKYKDIPVRESIELIKKKWVEKYGK